MIYITGDTHRLFSRFYPYTYNEEDMIIILGDAGINYYLNDEDKDFKDYLKRFNTKFFCIRGNHEERPEKILSYKEIDMFGGKVYLEEEYPYLIFAKDGEVYNIDNNKILVIGGAYSVDKNYRLQNGLNWFSDEQLTNEEMNKIFDKVKGQHFDIVLSHTCPHKYEPTEVFLPYLNQNMIDKRMEYFLDKIENNITYDKWYCGHYHTEKEIDKIEFMYRNIENMNKSLKRSKSLIKDIKK